MMRNVFRVTGLNPFFRFVAANAPRRSNLPRRSADMSCATYAASPRAAAWTKRVFGGSGSIGLGIRRGNTTIYIPIVTCIVLSLLLTLLLSLFRR